MRSEGKKTKSLELKDGLLAQEIGDELVVYDGATQRAHALNRTAAVAFHGLRQNKTLGTIAKEFRGDAGGSLAAAAVHELKKADLLKPGTSLPRRTALRGIAAALLPVVASVAVPPAASAQSCVPLNGLCNPDPDNCCPPFVCIFNGTFNECVDPLLQ